MKILNSKIATTRKPHQCFCCGRTFEKGSKMRVNTIVENEIFVNYDCETCIELMDKYKELFWDGELFQEFCVLEALQKGETPESLLLRLNAVQHTQ